jgi:hypothetical protein
MIAQQTDGINTTTQQHNNPSAWHWGFLALKRAASRSLPLLPKGGDISKKPKPYFFINEPYFSSPKVKPAKFKIDGKRIQYPRILLK